MVRRLPIVKYEGQLWYFDERLNELRGVTEGKPLSDDEFERRQRLDSSRLEAFGFNLCLKKTRPKKGIFDCDAYFARDEEVPDTEGD